MRNFDKYTKGVSTNAINTLNMYVPRIKVKSTVAKSNVLGLNMIQAKILNIKLSINEEVMVERLFLNHKKRLLVNCEIHPKNHTSKN